MPERNIEWRVATKHPRHDIFYQSADNESDAREWAHLERIDYPHFDVWIEWREVTPWVRVDPAASRREQQS